MSRRTLRVAGISYTVAWCVGLAVFNSSTTVSSTGGALLGQYAGHSAALALQFMLTQGLAGLLLGIVLAGWAALARGADRTCVGRVGGAAVCVSLVQCAIGLVLAWGAVPARNSHGVSALVSTLNRLDGLKMLLLAVVLACVASGHGVSLPRWAAVLCGSATVALLISAAGYGFLWDGPAMAAFVSLPLLLASVTAGAFVIAPAPSVEDQTGRSAYEERFVIPSGRARSDSNRGR